MTETEKITIDTLGDWERTHDCGSLRAEHTGLEVTLMGWVNSRRDLGNLIFIDLRDRGGLTQIVFDPQFNGPFHERAHILRNEWVLAVKGMVTPRLEGQENPHLPTGGIEVKVTGLKILNRTEVPPFQVDGAVDASETLRLKYRYLELRRPQVYDIFLKRHRITAIIRDYLNRRGFIEVETPFLTKSTPEGARDYLVPSRISKGHFYALPQSPQLFKQLLMIGGFDRYYQIVRCFRDEDLRADRQPEFTQIDLEMSFVNEEKVMNIFEGMMKELFKKVLDEDLPAIPRLTYKEALARYGTDKPDIRFDLELKEVTDLVRDSDFKVFQNVIEAGGIIKGIMVKGGAAQFSRKNLDELSDLVTEYGARGLAWLKVTEEGWQSSLSKFFSDEQKSRINNEFEAGAGDLVLIVAGRESIVNTSLGRLRLELAGRMNLIEKGRHAFLWVTEFPLFEYDQDLDRLEAAHHPFTSPMVEDLSFLTIQPGRARSRAYDLVLDGVEMGSGSIRNHDLSIQERIFRILGISREEAGLKFGFLLEALKYGAPPHGGMALGLDRLVAIMAGLDSIREVIAFPKTQKAACPLTDAPSKVDEQQLRELSIKVLEP